MAGNSWLLVAGNAVAASILLFASSAKLVSPDALSRSLLRLTGRSTMSSRQLVRAIGVIEAVIALGILVEPLRMTASGLLGLLGLAFIVLGITGRIRKVDEPCGCFGAASQQPLGNQNVALGLLVGIVGVANLVTAQQLSDNARTAVPMLAAALLCLACIFTGRSVLKSAKSESS
ncbi:MAG TPA: MauE/DoxX family redox-associated membrane protein [Jatrophihabitans sp.]|nr:MauE/DoxX family redox-associated membrane protein [Jatrophihabitans sp.]